MVEGQHIRGAGKQNSRNTRAAISYLELLLNAVQIALTVVVGAELDVELLPVFTSTFSTHSAQESRW